MYHRNDLGLTNGKIKFDNKLGLITYFKKKNKIIIETYER